MTPDVEQFIRDFKSVVYYNHKLISLNNELKRLEYKLTWGEKTGTDMTFDQMMSTLPMPTQTMRYMTQVDWDTMADIDLVEDEIKQCRAEIAKCLIAEALPHNDLQMMIARYWLNEPPEEVAERYGYSRPGMYKRFNLGLEKLVRVRDLMRRRKE